MGNNVLDLFKLFLRQNYLTRNVERVLNNILYSSEFSSKLIEQYKKMICMVGSEQNVLEIINKRLGNLNREVEENESKPLEKSLDCKSATQIDVKLKKENNLIIEVPENSFKNILEKNPDLLLGNSLLTNRNDLNWVVQKNESYGRFLRKIHPKKRVTVIISDSNLTLNPKIVNQQITLQTKKEIGFFKGHFIIELQKVVKQNISNVNQVKQSLINQLEEIMQVLYHRTLIASNSTVQVNSPIFYRCLRPLKNFPKETTTVERMNKIDITDIFNKGIKKYKLHPHNCSGVHIKCKESLKRTPIFGITPVNLNINTLTISTVNMKSYESFVKSLARKNLSHKINVLTNVLYSGRSKEQLLAKNLNILINIINSDNNNLIKMIYLKQQINKISNYMKFINFLKFTEMYMALSAVEQLDNLNLQYWENKEKYIKEKQKRENLIKELKKQLDKFKGIIKYEALEVNDLFKQLQPSFNQDLKILKPQYFKEELIQYETMIKNIKKENSELLEKIVKSINPYKIGTLKNNYSPVPYFKKSKNLFKKTEIINKINFRMEHTLNNSNASLCCIPSTDNSQWSQQIFPSGLNKKILNGSKTPALHNKTKGNSDTGADNIKERKDIMEINKKVFDDTEKKIKLIEILEKLKKRRRISQKSNLTHEGTTITKEKKTLNKHSKLKDLCVWTFNTHISTSKTNKIISKFLHDIVKEAIEGIFTKKYLSKSNVINQHKTKVQREDNDGVIMYKIRVNTLFGILSQYKNGKTLHFNQSSSSNNILFSKLEDIVATFQIIETKQNIAWNCSNKSKTHAEDDCKEENNIRAKNIHNEPPVHFKKYSETSILPECTIWNAYIKSPIKINCNNLSKRIKSQFCFAKKYRYETKEVASPKGDKIKITCLVTEDEVNVQ